jgi:hypothetical protein
MTATLLLTGEQILSLFAQLDPRAKREVLYQLAEAADHNRAARMAVANAALRRRAAERGADWMQMSEEERESLIDDLVHEDR